MNHKITPDNLSITTGEWTERWDRQLRWHLYLPPGRPSDLHLSCFRSHLRNASSRTGRVCVLGSTPELCDLIIEEGWKLTIIDRSESFHQLVQSLRVYPHTGTFINEDWTDALKRHVGAFDLVLGDLVLGNIPYNERRKFLSLVSQSLVDNGVYVEKILTCEAPRLTPDELAGIYKPRALNIQTINDFANAAFFRSTLQDPKEVIIPEKMFTTYKSMWFRDRRLSFLLKSAYELFPPNAAWFYGEPWHIVKRNYDDCFDGSIVLSEQDRRSPFCGNLVIMKWKKRGG